MISDSETHEIKQKLISHIESNFPAEQVITAKQQIESMNSDQLEAFLEKNKLIKRDNSPESAQEDCVFCSIVSGKINSVKIGENKKAIAVLEINPISKGHFIVIPKKHTQKITKEILNFAQKISKKIKEKLSPKTMDILNSHLFGHEIINILPIYNKETFNSERKSVPIEELEKLREELEKKKEVIHKKPKIKKIQNFWLPKKIP